MTTHDGTGRDEDVARLAELMKKIKFAMLTTVAPDGGLRSRPMATQQVEFDGDLWFFTGRDTDKVDEVRQAAQVNVSFSDPDDNRYVSVAGTATLMDDPEKAKELWSPLYKAWFPEGLDDPNLVLLKIEVNGAEYWDSPSSKMVQLVGLAKALTTGKAYEGGENRQIDLQR